ncbi:hypothetical protein ACXJJ3_35545 [Kribbella sp. WER1]
MAALVTASRPDSAYTDNPTAYLVIAVRDDPQSNGAAALGLSVAAVVFLGGCD